MYLIRLDDACEYMDTERWARMEELLDRYGVKPIVGIIPQCQDRKMTDAYEKDEAFWEKAACWLRKGWTPALHGYDHVYITEDPGVNPVNSRSEFAGVPLEVQKEKLREGYRILEEHGIRPLIFFAPAHTFDHNTLQALKETTPIRIVSDTVASDVYFENGIWYIPQQSGNCRKLPVKTATFCQHPNTMQDADFLALERFLSENQDRFQSFEQMKATERKRKKNLYDRLLSKLYFTISDLRSRKS